MEHKVTEPTVRRVGRQENGNNATDEAAMDMVGKVQQVKRNFNLFTIVGKKRHVQSLRCEIRTYSTDSLQASLPR